MSPESQTGLPWTPEDQTFWEQEIRRARDKRQKLLERWDANGNLESYAKQQVKDNYDIHANKDFADVERKKAALFYDLPQIALIPDFEETPSEALLLHQEFLNTLMGPDHMNVKATALQVNQDALVVIQPALSEIGYSAVIEEVEPPQQPGAILGLSAPVKVPAYEEFFWRHRSPRSSLIPADFRSTQYDKAPWIGYDWRLPVSQVRRWLKLDKDWKGGGDSQRGSVDKPYFDYNLDDEGNTEQMVSGSVVFYRAFLRDESVSHPLVCRQFVMIDGEKGPRDHKACPYQQIDPATGRLTLDSMDGYQVHPLSLRDLTDSAWVQADLTVVSPLTREGNKYRKQVIQRRDGSRLHVFYDTGIVDQDMKAKIEANTAPMMIGAMPGTLAQGKDAIMTQVPTLELGRENYIGLDIIDRDRAAVLGIRDSAHGTIEEGDTTATEVNIAQRNMDARFEQEHQRDLLWFLRGVRKLSALVIRYGDRMALDILGPKKGQLWVQAKQAGMFGKFRCTIVMNSGAYIDVSERMRQLIQVYNMTAKDPSTNRIDVLKEMATLTGLNPATWLVTQPPEPKPSPPSMSMAFKPEDLIPALESYVATYQILTQLGVKNLPPPTWAPPPVDPGIAPVDGMAEKADRLNQKQMDETGAMAGAGPI